MAPHHRRRRLFAAALATLVLAASERATTAAENSAWVSDDRRLHLRTEASESGDVLAVLENGDSLTVLQRQGDWVQVRAAEDRIGWVLGTYLKAEPPRAVLLETELRALQEALQKSLVEVDRLRGESESLRNAPSGPGAVRTVRSLADGADPGWPYLVAGAVILGVGLLWGMLLQWLLARRSNRSRLRL